MWNKLSRWFGFYRRDSFERRFYDEHNIRASIYMSIIVIALELWVMILVAQRTAAAGVELTLGWAMHVLPQYLILMCSGIVVLVYSTLYYKKILKNRLLGHVLVIAFCVIMLRFGINIGVHDYLQGNQILAFITMIIFTGGLYVLPPFLSFIFITGSYLIFFALCGEAALNDFGFKVNLFTTWISLMLVSISTYRNTQSVADQAELLQESNDALQQMVSYDTLTRVYSLHEFGELGSKVLEQSVPGSMTMLYVNVENFRAYNEAFGHKAGDELLKDLARELQKSFPEELVGRLDTDHFAVLTSADQSSYEVRFRELQEMISRKAQDIHLVLKIGAYVPEDTKEEVHLVMDKARTAARLLHMKGDQHLRFYDDALQEAIQGRQKVIGQLDQAIQNGYIKVFYQPVMDCQTEQVYGFEALARWEDPKRGLLSPGLFIPTLEECRMIDRLDQEIVRLVCQDLRSRMDRGLTVYPVSVNFSRIDFQLYDVPEFINRTCDAYRIPHDLIEVEVTESALSEQVGTLYKTLDRLEGDGYNLWLDDFGSGYSSLNVLQDYKFSVMKIDMAFMRNLEKNAEAKQIVRATINLAKEIGMIPLQEGVETEEQMRFLQEAGCARMQGYYFSKPRPMAEIEEMLDSGELYA